MSKLFTNSLISFVDSLIEIEYFSFGLIFFVTFRFDWDTLGIIIAANNESNVNILTISVSFNEQFMFKNIIVIKTN